VECKGGGEGNFIRCAEPYDGLAIMVDQCLGGKVPRLKVTTIQALPKVVVFRELHRYDTFKSSVNALEKKNALVGWLASSLFFPF